MTKKKSLKPARRRLKKAKVHSVKGDLNQKVITLEEYADKIVSPAFNRLYPQHTYVDPPIDKIVIKIIVALLIGFLIGLCHPSFW